MSRVPDIQLRQFVVEALELDPGIDARTIGVAVEDGIITLTGTVGSNADRVNVETIVRHVPGVEGLADELGVRLPVDAERDDTDIARAAVHALAWLTTIPKDHVKVTVTRGWLTLDGDVEWQYQKRAAQEAVEGLIGVRGVTNKVAVTLPPAQKDDRSSRPGPSAS